MPQEVEQVQTSAPVGWSGKMSPELSAPTKERTLGQSSRKQSKSQSRKSPLFLSLRTDGQQPDASPMWEKTMSIEKDYDIYIAVCDICGDDIGPFEDFYDAVDAKKAAGWRSRKDAHGEWIDLCPACQHPSAASDFGGVI